MIFQEMADRQKQEDDGVERRREGADGEQDLMISETSELRSELKNREKLHYFSHNAPGYYTWLPTVIMKLRWNSSALMW